MLVSFANLNLRPQRRGGRRWMAVAGGMWSCPLAGVCGADAIAADLAEAQRLYNTGEYHECVQLAAAEIEGGNYVESWRRLKIEAELAQGEYDAALTTVEEAMQIYPAQPPAAAAGARRRTSTTGRRPERRPNSR